MKTNRIIAAAAALTIAFGAGAGIADIGGAAFTASASTDGITMSNAEFTYLKFNDCIFIIDVTSEAKGDIVVPDKIDGLPVVHISTGAFSNNSKITSVTIPEGVESIGDYVFQNDRNLREVSIPSSVLVIGSLPLLDSNAIERVNISEDNKRFIFEDGCLFSLDKDGNYDTLLCFATVSCKPIKKITQPVKEIAFGAFTNLDTLIVLELPSTVEKINMAAFNNCENLTSIDFSKSLKEFDSYCIFNCPSVDKISMGGELNGSNENFVIKDNVLFSKDMTTLVYYAPVSHVKKYVVPETVTAIQPKAFNDAFLETVTLPDALETISVGAFDYSTIKEVRFLNRNDNFIIEDGILYSADKKNIIAVPPKMKVNKLVVPDTVEYIVGDNFKGALTGAKVVLSGNTKLSSYAFDQCEMYEIDIDNGITEIPEFAFYCCGEMREIDIPMSVEIVKENAFQYCDKLESIVFSKNVVEIQPNALNDCASLSTITIENPECFIDLFAMDKVREEGNKMCTIKGYDDSTAERYAALWGFNFESLGPAPSGKALALGDVNGDGEVNSSDASAILAEYALVSTGGKETFNYEMRVAADVNADNAINSSDASKVLKFYSYTSTGGKIKDMAEWMKSND